MVQSDVCLSVPCVQVRQNSSNYAASVVYTKVMGQQTLKYSARKKPRSLL